MRDPLVVNLNYFFGPSDIWPSSSAVILMIVKSRVPDHIQGLMEVIEMRDVAVGMIRIAPTGSSANEDNHDRAQRIV